MPPAEREEVLRVLSSSGSGEVMDRCKALSVELDALQDILEEFQQQNQKIREELQRRPVLPQHPARAMLEQKIVLLINSVKQSASQHARALLSPSSRKEQKVKEYVMRKLDVDAGALAGVGALSAVPALVRPGTAASGRSGRSARSAPAESILEPLDGFLDVYALEAVTADLQEAMREEEAELLEEIEYVQSLLEMEHEDITKETAEVLAPPPPLEDMRDYSAKLEKTWLMEDLESCAEPSRLLVDQHNKALALVHNKTIKTKTKKTSSRTVRNLHSAVHQARSASDS